MHAWNLAGDDISVWICLTLHSHLFSYLPSPIFVFSTTQPRRNTQTHAAARARRVCSEAQHGTLYPQQHALVACWLCVVRNSLTCSTHTFDTYQFVAHTVSKYSPLQTGVPDVFSGVGTGWLWQGTGTSLGTSYYRLRKRLYQQQRAQLRKSQFCSSMSQTRCVWSTLIHAFFAHDPDYCVWYTRCWKTHNNRLVLLMIVALLSVHVGAQVSNNRPCMANCSDCIRFLLWSAWHDPDLQLQSAGWRRRFAVPEHPGGMCICKENDQCPPAFAIPPASLSTLERTNTHIWAHRDGALQRAVAVRSLDCTRGYCVLNKKCCVWIVF